MNGVERQLLDYFDALGMMNLRIESLPGARQKLPVFIGNAYEFSRLDLYGKRYIVLLRKDSGDNPTPAEAMKQAEIVRAKLGEDALFVFASLKPFERKRWVEKGLPFIVPGSSFFCPRAVLDFRGKAKSGARSLVKSRESVSAPAQALLLYYLLNEVRAHNLAEWAELLHYTPMTISRAKKELQAADLCEVADSGRSVFLRFSTDKQSLWQKSQPILRSPVMRSAHAVINSEQRPQLLLAGISALSSMTMLADDPEPTFAVSSAEYRAAVEEGSLVEQPIRDGASVVIQHWRYSPALLASDRDAVDPLSLYLSLRDDPDERVQLELTNLIEGVIW